MLLLSLLGVHYITYYNGRLIHIKQDNINIHNFVLLGLTYMHFLILAAEGDIVRNMGV